MMFLGLIFDDVFFGLIIDVLFVFCLIIDGEFMSDNRW